MSNTFYVLGIVLLVAVGVVALVRADGSPAPGAVRTAGILMIAVGIVQGSGLAVHPVIENLSPPPDTVLLVNDLSVILVEVLYGLLMTGALTALVIALMRSRSAAARPGNPAAAGPRPGHAPAPGQPYVFGQARQVPPGHGYRGHPGPRAGSAYPGRAGSYGGDAGDCADWNPGDGGGSGSGGSGGGFFGSGLFGGGDSGGGGGGGGDGGGGGAG
ncbi:MULTISPECIES: hypothetical protein [Nocardiopsis]|uniref:Uncharacterized protein n=1 Tax=Nocardiopsis sinuspersici TaxID=501010 RepID=A0A1V3C542_9ACTN|nr:MULTISPECIES: hypothetical protein [Nocardiopsis]OOC55845.1 hypothetical protein NOSIN_20085 [Nocardiopsis sinuspersici]